MRTEHELEREWKLNDKLREKRRHKEKYRTIFTSKEANTGLKENIHTHRSRHRTIVDTEPWSQT